MVDLPLTSVKVPESEIARQATDALGGYVYQLDYTVLMWLTLGNDEALHIEFAEDVAISSEGKLDLKQVKRVAANITLRTDGVAKLITSVWQFQKENPSRQVSGALLTTSGIGKERKMSFPGKVPGLVYWRAAAREGADVEPIREALLTLDLHEDLQTFIRESSATELRERIIRPIRWLAARADHEELRHDIEERLVLLGDRMGVAAVASKNARHFLIGALLDSIVEPAARRYVTRARLIEIFQKRTFVSVPPSLLEGLAAPAAALLSPIETIARNVAEFPLPGRFALRQELVDKLRTGLISKGGVWLHGSSGLGKSTLAVLLARSQGVEWRLIDLRDFSVSAIRSMLVVTANSFRRTGARGLILDDVPAETDNSVISALGQLARAVADADGVLIITSTKPPQPTLAGRLQLDSKAIIRVPYLSAKDVADVVSAGGGDSRKWATHIHAFAGGHPQLVDARVAGLRQRGWDDAELLAGIAPLKNIPNDIAEERKAVRGRLLQGIPSSATEFLLRLSLLYGNFDRPMALVVGETPLAIAQAGLVFDFLVGPWIEQVGPSRYRLSPLLRDSGSAGLAVTLQRDVRSKIMNHLMVQRPFPADQLLQVFLIAFQQNDRDGLTWFGHAVLSASSKPKESHFKRLALEISAFTFADRGEGMPLIPDDTRLSTMLRFAQLRVAVATDDMKVAAKIVDRALFENSLVEGEARQHLDAVIFATVIMEPHIPVRPQRWFAMLQKLMAAPLMQQMFAVPLPRGLVPGLLPTTATDEMMFIARGAALQSVNELVELIDTLEDQPKETRDRYLGAAARTNQSLHLIVSASWLAEVKKPGFDGPAAAAAYRTLGQGQAATDSPDLAVELFCAEAIMLDDYVGDKDGALEVLRIAQEAHPSDYRLNRQRQKVLYRHGQHDEALAEFEKFRDRLPKDRAVDRAYAMREAARSAAEIGDLEKARTFFEEAWDSARICGAGMKPMTAGLSADCAILDFDAGKNECALNLMRRALLEADDLDPSAGLREAFVKRVLLAAIIYMRGAAPDFPAARQARIYGMCSEPEPQEWFRSQPQTQPLLAWYMLAELEAEISHSQAVLTELRRRTTKGELLPLETMLAARISESAVRHLDVDRFLDSMKTYPRAVTEGARVMKEQRGLDLFNMPIGNLKPIAETEWSSPAIATAVKHGVLCFMLASAATGRPDIIADLQEKILRVPGLAKAVENVFLSVEQPSGGESDTFVIISTIIGRLLRGEVLDADDVFWSAVYAIQFLEGSVLAPPAAEALMSFYERLWPAILEERGFSMRSPTTNGPIILEAVRKDSTAMQRIASMVLATNAAVKRGLSNDLRERLSRIATKRIRPEALMEE